MSCHMECLTININNVILHLNFIEICLSNTNDWPRELEQMVSIDQHLFNDLANVANTSRMCTI